MSDYMFFIAGGLTVCFLFAVWIIASHIAFVHPIWWFGHKATLKRREALLREIYRLNKELMESDSYGCPTDETDN